MGRDITPPPSKRCKVAQDESRKAEAIKIDDHLNVLRVYSWNINGITPFLQTALTSFFPSKSPSKRTVPKDAPASLRDFLRRHKWPQILCLQEVKIAPSDTQTLNALKRAVNVCKLDTEPSYEVFTTLPSDKFNARGPGGKGRVYGVASIIRSDFHAQYVSRIRTVEWDAEGRFSIIDVVEPGLGGRRLSIWNVYAVNGTLNEYRDSRTGEILGMRHDRKIAVHRLMVEECKKFEEEGWDVLVIGDLNVAPARIDGHPNLRTFPEQHIINRADFNKRFLDTSNKEGLGCVDVWRALKGGERKYTYYPRNRPWGSSCDRVDLTIASRRLLEQERIVGCEIWDSEMERGPSDHCPISVKISLERKGSEDKKTEDVGRLDGHD
jgi:exonuclease III